MSFFRSIADKGDILAKKTALKLMWGLEENEISDSIYSTMEEKYSPQLKKGKPQKILEAWMEDMDLSEDKALGKLAGMSVFYKNMGEFLEDLSFAQEGDLKRCQGRHYDSEDVYKRQVLRKETGKKQILYKEVTIWQVCAFTAQSAGK